MNQPELADMLMSRNAEKGALPSNDSDLADEVWRQIVTFSNFSVHPITIEMCRWPQQFSLPPNVARSLLVRFDDARTDAAACIAILCIRRVRRITGAGALWPIRNTVRDFLLHTDSSRYLMRELKPKLLHYWLASDEATEGAVLEFEASSSQPGIGADLISKVDDVETQGDACDTCEECESDWLFCDEGAAKTPKTHTHKRRVREVDWLFCDHDAKTPKKKKKKQKRILPACEFDWLFCDDTGA
jgi:hypothetical protein